jgi:hypothetical protein
MKEITDFRDQGYLERQPFVIKCLRENIGSNEWSQKNYAQIEGSSENFYLIFLSKAESVRIKALFIMKGIINYSAFKPLTDLGLLYKKFMELKYDAILSFITEQLKPHGVDIGDSGESKYAIPNIPHSATSSAASSATPEYADVGADVVVDDITSQPYYLDHEEDNLTILKRKPSNTFLVSKPVTEGGTNSPEHIYTIYVVSESLYNVGTQDNPESTINKFHIYYKESSGKIVIT